MRKTKSKGNLVSKVSKYLPVLIILLSITIIVGSTFAYFTDKKESTSELTFSKVELSSETTTGVNGKIFDVIPGSKIVDGALSFSKGIDSEPIYVRAKISFSLPNEYESDEDMKLLLEAIRGATDFNILNIEQNGAVWSAKDGNYYYLVVSDDTAKLKVVDTIDTYILSNELVIPRDLEQLEGNAQYMKGINFHISFEAIQASNVSDTLSETKDLFNELFPANANEIYKTGFTITFMGEDKTSVYNSQELEEGQTASEIKAPLSSGERKVFEGWYIDAECTTKYDFNSILTEDITLYPNYVTGDVITIMNEEGTEVLQIIEVVEGEVTREPSREYAVDESGTSTRVIEGWYLESEYVTKFKFDSTISQSYTLYPKVLAVSENLAFTEIITSGNVTGYIVAQGTCTDEVVVIPENYLGKPVQRVASSAFKDNTTITQVVLPNTINDIWHSAFRGCTKLEEINIPYGVGSIPNYGFNGCSSLKTINIPTTVTNIISAAFAGCTSIEELDIPEGVTEIGNNAIANCKALKSITIPSTVTTMSSYAITNCTGLTEINFNAINMANISSGNNAFNNSSECENEITLNIGAKVTKIPAYLFAVTSTSVPINITEIVFEEGSVCESINSNAFAGLTNLVKVELPNSITTIASGAFINTGLTTLTISKNVKTIGTNPFAGCNSLSLVVDSENTDYYIEDKCLVKEDGKTIVSGTCATTIPSDILKIGNSAFSYSSLTSIVIPSGVTEIGSSAFLKCENLSNLTLNEGLIVIGSGAFSGCFALTKLTIPKTVTTLNNTAFNYCTGLTEVNFNATSVTDLTKDNFVFGAIGKESTGVTLNIGANVTNIPAYLFYPYSSDNTYIPNLKTIVFEENSVCSVIGKYAFAKCTNLTNAVIPVNLTSLGDGAYQECTALTNIEFNASSLADLSSSNYVFYNAGKEGEGISVIISKDVTKIPAYIFDPNTSSSYTPNIISLIFEEDSNCTTIGAYAFTYTNLTTLTLPESITTIGEFAFCNANSLVSLTIPENVTTIGSNAFDLCLNLTTINFNAINMNDITSSTRVFRQCGESSDGITLNIGAKVTKIPAFLCCVYFNGSYYSPNITSVVFEEGSVCDYIGQSAFYQCTNIKSIILPNSITSIGNYVFTSVTAYILCENSTIASYVVGANGSNVYVKDATTDFSGITFSDVTGYGDVNGTYTDSSTNKVTYVRIGETGAYVYYALYTA